MAKSSLFRDPKNPHRVGKGSWRRHADEDKVGETIERVFGEKPVNAATAGRKRYIYRNGEAVEVQIER